MVTIETQSSSANDRNNAVSATLMTTTTTKVTSRIRAVVALLSLLSFFVVTLSSYRDSRILSPTSSSSSANEREDAALREAFHSYRLNAPLFEAVKSGDVELVRAMLRDGIGGGIGGGGGASFYNVNAEDANGITPLIEASLLGDVELVSVLLSAGARAQPLPGYRHTPLRAACLTGNARLIRLLLEEGADPNSRSEGGRTPLMGACYLRPRYDEGPDRNELSYGAVSLLLSDPRTDPSVENDFGETALDLCRERMYNKSMALLRERISGGKKKFWKAKGGKLLKNAVGKLRGKKKKRGKK
ncbi:hypothetical protein ACHAW5_002392 [Stephanodiscus triporus]|uniref:Uncharacterized protein n=1 Tax=Stephanodiscus triporus TaxID=2934178 RepID=A0ABD3N6X4_9STRA